MNSDKRQTVALIGVALTVAGALLIYVALTQPKVYDKAPVQTTEAYYQSEKKQDSNTRKNKNSDSNGNSGEAVSYPVNLNTATLDELISIDGIGEARAADILEYRDYLGGYTSVSQIKEISGISDSVYSQVEAYLTV